MSISNLPTEVWQEILVNLSFIDLMSARQVCKTFHELGCGDYFMKNYPYAPVIGQATNWKKKDDGYKINTKENNLKIHLMGLCMQHGDYELFNRLLNIVRNKKKGFRMNWIDIYYYAGLGGQEKSFEFLQNVTAYRESHGESCMKGALIGNQLNLVKCLKDKHKIDINLRSGVIYKMVVNNCVEVIKYLYTIDRPYLMRYCDSYTIIKPLINNRSAELMKLLLNLRSRYVKEHIINTMSLDADAIQWLIDNEIIDLTDPICRTTLMHSSNTDKLIFYVQNDFIKKSTINWCRQLTNLMKSEYYRRHYMKPLIKFIIKHVTYARINSVALMIHAIKYKYKNGLRSIYNELGIQLDNKELLDYLFAHDIKIEYETIKDIYCNIDFKTQS